MGGEIVAETSGGNRLDYLTDALGSVTAKIDEAFVVVTTARYKPYGDLLTGSSYKFGWVGSLGYRASVNGSYIRARHYFPGKSVWTSVDYLWPRQLAYQYCLGDPVLLVDREGLSPVVTRKPFIAPGSVICGGCGLAGIEWTFEISPKKKVNGWLVQRIKSTYDFQKCDPSVKFPDKCPPVYFEAWKVVEGEVLGPAGSPNDPWSKWEDPALYGFADDGWSRPAAGKCTYGSQSVNGDFQFFTTNLSQSRWLESVGLNGFAGCAGALPASEKLKVPFIPMASGQGFMTTSWGCCQREKSLCDKPPNVECKKCDFAGPCYEDKFISNPPTKCP